jgi:endonuclease YncB( thermonuclease family)
VKRRRFLGAALIFAAAPASAAEPRRSAPAGEEARAVEVIDGGTLRLADGRILRLAGILPPGRWEQRRPGALAAAARSALAGLTTGQTLRLETEGAPPDRYGRILAHLFHEDGLWVEGELLRRGMARVATAADDRAFAAEMLRIEGEARRARTGLWAERIYRVRAPDELEHETGSFQIVEGTVLAAAQTRAGIFLNFGADRRTDSTVRIGRAALPLFRDAAFDPVLLGGRRVRVRGFVFWDDGPMIEATHPEQIELPDSSDEDAGLSRGRPRRRS